MSMTPSRRSVENASRMRRFSSSSNAWSAPRLRIGTTSSEQHLQPRKYGSLTNRSSATASPTRSGSRVRSTYRTADNGIRRCRPAASSEIVGASEVAAGKRPGLALLVPQQQLDAGSAGHVGQDLDDPFP